VTDIVRRAPAGSGLHTVNLKERAIVGEMIYAVVFPLLLALDVHDGKAVIEQYPAVFPHAFATLRLEAIRGQGVFDFFDNGAYLTLIICRRDDEKFRTGQNVRDINDSNVAGGLVIRSARFQLRHLA